MEPLKLSPILKKTIWGGNRLSTEYKKGDGVEDIAESWELTSRVDGVNTIDGGAFDKKSIEEVLKENPSYIGTSYCGDRFPLLIKMIDAEDDLSIQVHPDDEYALSNTTDLGKTEMWYIISCKPGAKIIYGLKEKYTSKQIKEAISSGTLESLMNYVDVKAGETYFIPSGMVHAICKGILIAEIQQNSNITYRVYDYNRRQKDGSLRQLHVDDALKVIEKFNPDSVKSIDNEENVIAKCKYFTVRKFINPQSLTLNATTKSFEHVMFVEESGNIQVAENTYIANKGDSFFIPAGLGEYKITSNGVVIVSSL